MNRKLLFCFLGFMLVLLSLGRLVTAQDEDCFVYLPLVARGYPPRLWISASPSSGPAPLLVDVAIGGVGLEESWQIFCQSGGEPVAGGRGWNGAPIVFPGLCTYLDLGTYIAAVVVGSEIATTFVVVTPAPTATATPTPTVTATPNPTSTFTATLVADPWTVQVGKSITLTVQVFPSGPTSYILDCEGDGVPEAAGTFEEEITHQGICLFFSTGTWHPQATLTRGENIVTVTSTVTVTQ